MTRARISKHSVKLLVLLAVWSVFGMTAAVAEDGQQSSVLSGKVESDSRPLSGYQVKLYAAFNSSFGPEWECIGNATSNTAGNFQIVYGKLGGWLGQTPPVLFVQAVNGSVMLASAIGSANDPPANIVVNELTTVATGTAFAQFIHNEKIEGNTYGVSNALRMAANFADATTGKVGRVITSPPNGTETTTFATFNSLANIVASCVVTVSDCEALFEATTPIYEKPPTNVLQAVANIVKHPSFIDAHGDVAALDPLFVLSQHREIYAPSLTQTPTNWLLFLKITGGFYSTQDSSNLMNGPGNFAIDKHGDAWLLDNYISEPPNQYACTGRVLIELTPWGGSAPGSPFRGGGLSGAGYGITFDPQGTLWIGNFGFQDPPCAELPQAATNDSVSVFGQDGVPLSPVEGYTQGKISWPQGTVSDRKGTIWVASCGNDSVTEIPDGDPSRAVNIPLGSVPAANDPQLKPFGAVIDAHGYLWVTNNHSDTISVVSPVGMVDTLPGTYQGKTVLSHPVGDAVDSKGNVWVSNSDWLDVPCPTATRVGDATHPSITVYKEGRREPYAGSPFTGGGLTVPWGIAVDGKDTVWVFNFGSVPVGQKSSVPTGISHFCGMETRGCPSGMQVGDPISPSSGYQSDSLIRITGGQIDPSGNIWITGNWKIDATPSLNPGGNSIVIAVAAAAPVQTPLIGPPVPFQRRSE